MASPSTYEIVVQGELGDRWSRWLAGTDHTVDVREVQPEATVLTVLVRDQPALRGALNQLWDLNLTLIGVRRIQPHPGKEGGRDE
jgi:hypothetical protein